MLLVQALQKKVFAIMWEHDDDPEIIVEKEGLKQISDDGALRQMAEEVIAKNDKVVQDYLSGKEAAIQALWDK